MRLKTMFAVGAAVAALTAVAAPAAQAQGDPLGDAGGLVGGLLDGLSDTLCDPVTGLPIGGEDAGALVCNLDVLTYKFRTVYNKPGGGTITRETNALINVPALLNVDSDLLPDLVGTVEVLSLDRFRLHVDRAVGETSDLRALVEILVDDPTGTLPRDRISLGYDARQGRAPSTWDGQIDLLQITDARSEIGLTFEKTGTAPHLAVVGGMFDGQDAGARQNPISARLDYAPVPSQVGATVAIGDEDYEVELTTSSPTTLNAFAKLVDGDDTTTASSRIEQLPSSLKVRYAKTGADTADVVYEASAPVAAAQIGYRQLVDGVLRTQAEAYLWDVPTGLHVQKTSKTAGNITTSGGPIGIAKVGFGLNREPEFPDSNEPALAFETAGTFADPGNQLSLALRVDRLQSASFDAGTPLALEAQFAPGTPLNFNAEAQDSHSRLEGRVEGLPAHVKLGVDTVAGHIEYDGFGQPVQKITLHGVADPGHPFIAAGGYDHIDAKVTGLPPAVTVDFAPDGERFDVVASQPIGEVEADLHRGATGCLVHLPNLVSGAAFADLPGESCVAGRIDGVRELHVEPDPLKASFKAAASQTVKLYATFEDPSDAIAEPAVIEGTIADLPSELSIERGYGFISQDPGARQEKIFYTANGDVADIFLTLRNMPGGEAGQLRHGDFHLADLPHQLEVAIPTTGTVNELLVDTGPEDEGIGYISVDLRDGGEPAVLPAEDYVKIDTHDGGLHVAAKVFDLASASFRSPMTANPLSSGTFKAELEHREPAQPLTVDVLTDDTEVDVEIPQQPQRMSVERTGNYSAANFARQQDLIRYRSDAPSTPELSLGLRVAELAMRGTFEDLPQDFDLCLWTGYGGMISDPAITDSAMCYQPQRTLSGGDPFNVYDNVQVKLDSIGPLALPDPLVVDILDICTGPTGTSWETCANQDEPDYVHLVGVEVGEATIALGSGVIYPCNADSGLNLATYGTLFDSEECDDQDENSGAHLAFRTDHHGLKFHNIFVKSTPDPPAEVDEVESMWIAKTGTPLTGNGYRTIDMNFPPTLDYKSGTINCGEGMSGNVSTWIDDIHVEFPLPDGTIQSFLEC